jgi:hypothetical protein
VDNDLLLAAIDAAEQSSYSSEGDTQLSTDRAYAIDMYLGKNLEPAPEGRSQVIDRSVFETIQWILPSLVDIFANGDDVVNIPPVGPEDEGGAKQEGQYLNHVILQKNPEQWLITFITWALDAMMTKNGYCLAYSEKRRNEDIDRYERQTEQGVKLLMQDKDVQVEVDSEYPDPDYVEPPPQPVIDPMTGQPSMDPMTGQPVMQPPPPAPMLYDVTVVRVAEERKVCYKSLPPERCKISYHTPDFSVSPDCPYFEYYDYKTLSDLREEGFKLPEEIPDDWSIDEEEDLARDQYDEQSWRQQTNEPDPSMRRYKVRMIWIKHDDNEDGIAERLYVVRIGQHILFKERVSRIPVASLVAIPNAHRHIGTSIADIVVDLQRIKTAILRQGLDNLYLANNPRTFITDKINLDDALISRPGGIVRGDTGAVYGQDIAPLVMPFVFPQAMEGLEYMDQVRENRTGTNRYFTGIDQNAMNKTASGIQQLSSMAAQRVKLIARIMGIGVASLFSIVHELIIKGGHKKEVVQLSNNWVEIDPAQWKKRTDFRLAVAYAAGNKDALVAKLMMIAAMQEKALAGGLPIVTAQNAYETALELTKASDFSAPQRFWTNPKEIPPPEPPKPDPTMVAVEEIKSKTTLQKTQEEIKFNQVKTDKELMIESQRLELEKYKTDVDAQVKLTIADAQMEHDGNMEDRKTRNQAGLKQMEGQQSQDFEEHKQRVAAGLPGKKKELADKQTDAKVQMLDQEIQRLKAELKSAQSTRKRIVRKGGKASAIEVLDEQNNVVGRQQIIRGPDGTIEGIA